MPRITFEMELSSTTHLIGPEDVIAAEFSNEGRKIPSFGSVFFEKIEVSRECLEMIGWAIFDSGEIIGIELPEKWRAFVKESRFGLQRDHVVERISGSSDQMPGFAITVRWPPQFRDFWVEFRLSDNRSMRIRPTRKLKRELRGRYLRNWGHRHLSWAKPLKRAIKGKSRLPKQSTSRGLRWGTDVEAHTLIHAGRTGGEVLLPVFNGYQYLTRLLPGLIDDSAVRRLVIIDDASTDQRVGDLLKEVDRESKVTLFRNEKNLGFLASANRGFSLMREDFVLLNTDVELPRQWIERLLEPIRRDPSIASTTPFSNAATLMSFPVSGENNSCFEGLDVDSIDRQFQKLRSLWPPIQLPTGVGFCMGISKRALDQIGYFDAVFGRGYGEENDWCQRAKQVGFRNVAVTNLYVHHVHGGSFEAEEKSSLLRGNLRIVAKKHPGYHSEVQDFYQEDPLAPYRELAALDVLSHCCRASEVAVIFDHDHGGGAAVFRHQRVEAISESGGVAIVIMPANDERGLKLKATHSLTSLEFKTSSLSEMRGLLNALPVTSIEINSLMFFADPFLMIDQILAWKAMLSIDDLTLYLHDFHSLCPSHNLIDHKGRFCDLPDFRHCLSCLQTNPFASNGHLGDREVWVAKWHDLIEEASEVRAFSDSSRELFCRVFPALETKVRVQPHEPNSVALRPVQIPQKSRPVVGVVGNISHAKGAGVVRALAQFGACEVVVIGDIAGGKLPDDITHHGSYRREELLSLIETYEISVGLIPSVWPETYNFVTDELMAMRLPLVCFEIGAHAERIRAYPFGKVLPLGLSEDALALMNEIALHCSAFRKNLET